MEGDFPSDPFNIKEEGEGEADYSFAINGVIGVSGIDWFFQLGRECFLTNPQSRQEMLVPLSIRAQVSTAFKVCEGLIS